MANNIQFYEDSACTSLWRTVPCDPLVFTSIGGHGGQPGILAVGGKTYNYYDSALPTLFYNAEQIRSNPFLTFNRPEETRTVYCKNGFSMRVGSDSNRTIFSDFRYNGESLPFDDESAATGRYWAITFFDTTTGKNYIGFTRQTGSTWEQYIPPIACIEIDFWNDAFRPPYDYGTKPDGNGGQGNGKIPHTPIGFSSKPTISLPTGDHGLHAYRIDSFAYDDFQAYLWGQGSTLAKNLWQKFVNSKTNPAGCVVACYRLPKLFMPSGTVTDGIKIAGVKMPRGAGVIREVVLGFTDYAVKIGHVAAPFGSWADYCGATVTISIPLCGDFTAPLEKVWDKDVFVKYRVDLSNGNLVGMACTGTCAEDGSSYSMEYLLGEMSGNVAYNVPISGGDDGTLTRIGAVIGAVGNVVSGFVTGVQNAAGYDKSSNNNVINASEGLRGSTGAMMSAKSLQYAGDIIMPPFQSHLINPNLSGNMSACSNGIAYAEYQIACIAYPPNYGNVMGYPARSSSGRLRDFTGGYGEFYVSADFDIHGATYEEKEEIVALLESGVFV